jgi:predicted transcriptional regulator
MRNRRDLKAMTRMLDEAIKKVRELPDSVQDDAAEMLFSVAAKQGEPVRLDEETRAAVREGRAQARRGEFASDEDMQAFFERHGVKR